MLSFERAIRGGISGIMGKRYFKANNEFKLLYIDANNLYGWAMKQEMPLKNFKMYQPDEEITKEHILGILDDSSIGFFLEVDLEYPETIKTKHIIFHFALNHYLSKMKSLAIIKDIF